MKKNILISLLFFSLIAQAQDMPAGPVVSAKNGLQFNSEQDNFSLRLGFRVQSRFTYEDYDEDSTSEDLADFQVRRLRLRLDGNAFQPNLKYNLQFAFTRGDLDYDTVNYPNILRDANISWEWSKNQFLILGLRKLPGNRQRLVSSGAQEFVDRALTNSTFNIDRDNGIQSRHQWGESQIYRLQLALSNGEGRGQNNRGSGLSSTARVEWLPFGAFREDGDFIEGDVLFEPESRVSVGVTYNKNRDTFRLGGQIGALMENNARRDLESYLADFLWKRQGYSLSVEHFNRNAEEPIVSATQTIYEGTGTNVQFSYVFPNFYSPALRWSKIEPRSSLVDRLDERTHWTVGLSRYLNRHKVKIQGDITSETVEPRATSGRLQNTIFRLQFEYGI